MIRVTGIPLPLYDNVHTIDLLQRTQKAELIVGIGGVGLFKIWVVPIFLVKSSDGFIAVYELKPLLVINDDVPINVLFVLMF